MVDYPPIGEHVGNRAESPSGELGTRAESSVTPADAELLELLAKVYSRGTPPTDEQLEMLSRDMDRGELSARLRALADALRKITPLQVHLLNRYIEMACTCGVVSADDEKDWAAAVARVPELLATLETLAAGARFVG